MTERRTNKMVLDSQHFDVEGGGLVFAAHIGDKKISGTTYQPGDAGVIGHDATGGIVTDSAGHRLASSFITSLDEANPATSPAVKANLRLVDQAANLARQKFGWKPAAP